MIRLPTSSISLSQTDVDSQLQYLKVYHGLLEQGFKKKEIRRYLRRHAQKDKSSLAVGESKEPSLRALTDVELAIANATRAEHVLQARPDMTRYTDANMISKKRIAGRTSVETASTILVQRSEAAGPVSAPDPDSTPIRAFNSPSALSLSGTAPSTGSYQAAGTGNTGRWHVPRQSSLLRFTKTVSSNSSQNDDYEVPQSHVSSASIDRTAHAYEVSRNDATTIGRTITPTSEDHVHTSLEHLTLDSSLVSVDASEKVPSRTKSALRPEARVFSPIRLPPPFSTTRRVSSSSWTTTPIRCPPIPEDGSDDTTSTSPSAMSEYPYSTRIGQSGRCFEAAEYPSSPPVMFDDHTLYQPERAVLSSSIGPPVTPLGPGRSSYTRAEPTSRRYRHPGGDLFTVYDDSLPANSQPQTQHDVSRQTLPLVHDAAYTAPPGRIRNRLSSGVDDYSPHTANYGDQSPTVRAIGIRQRRHREYARSARVEGLRLNRVRDDMRMTWTDERATQDTAAAPDRRGRPVFRALDNTWRDDLDADRVGEENFEEAEALARMATGGLRVVSGNWHVHAGNGGD